MPNHAAIECFHTALKSLCLYPNPRNTNLVTSIGVGYGKINPNNLYTIIN